MMEDKFILPSDLDSTPSAAAATSDKFVLPSDLDSTNEPTVATTAMALPVGVNRGIANTLGAPVDLANWGMRKIGLPVSETPFGGSESIKKGMGLIGANPDTHLPRSVTEKYLQAGGEGVGSMVGGELAAAPLLSRLATTAPKTAEALGSVFGTGKSGAATATNALVGGVGSVTGEAAAELAPDKYKAPVRALGSIAGGLPVAGTAVGVRAAKDAIVPKVGEFLEPFTKTGQEAAASRQFKELFADPSEAANRLQQAKDFRDIVAPGQPLGEIVPGSRPTTPQLTADPNALAFEREMATASPQKFNENEFGTGAAQQNAARVRAQASIEPNGRPEDVPSLLNRQLAQIDAQHEAAVNAATAQAQRQGSGVGQGQTPEAVGNTLRNHLDDAQRASEAHENALWRAVDPENQLALSANRVSQEAHNIVGGNEPTAKPIGGEEAAILDTAQNLDSVIPFNHMVALRKRINAEMRAQKDSNPVAYGRLSRLQSVVTDSINNAAEHQAAQEQAAVARGELAPENTAWARLQQEANDFLARRREAEARGSAGTGAADAGEVGSSAISPTDRGEVPGGGGLGDSAGNQGIQGQSLVHNFDDAAAARLAAANAATREQKQTFGQGPVAKVLATKGTRDNYRVNEGSVPGELLKKGPEGYAASEAYQRAVNGDPAAMHAFHDAAAESLRRTAMDGNGMIDVARFNNWARQHADMLRTLPPELRQRFQNAAAATQAVADAAAARLQATRDYQAGVIGKVMGISDPRDVTKTIGGILGQKDAVQQMTRLRAAIGNDPDANAGLRRAIMDSIIAKSQSTNTVGVSGIESIKPDAFKRLLRDNSRVLEAAGFDRRQIGTLHAIADDITRSQPTLSATKLPGQSNTAADLLAHMKREGQPKESFLNKAWKAMVAGKEGAGTLGALGGLTTVAGHSLVGKFRDAGLNSIRSILEEGIRNPELGLQLLQPLPKVARAGSEIKMGNLLGRMSQFAVQKYASPTPNVQTRASGGRVNIRDYPAKKASHIEKQMNRICKAYGGELNPMLHADDNAVARAMRLANRGGFADGGRVAPEEEGTVEGPTLNPFGVDPDRVRQITGLKPQGPLPGPAGIFGADIAKQAVEGAANAATLPGDAYLGKVDLSSDEGLGRVINMAGTLAQTGLPMAEAGAAGIFGGKLTHDPAGFAKLGEGKDMLTAGVNPRDTYLRSGAWKGPEGMMRYEIPDYNATLKTGAEAAIRTGKNFAGPLKDFVDHPEFFKAYPDLADTTVLFDPSRTSHHGYFASGSNLIKLYGHEPSQVQSVLLHEMQHAVQHKEGFTPGWSLEGANDEATALLNKAEDLGMSRNQRLAFWNRFDPYDAYRRAAGEVEARAVQARAGLTPEQAAIFSPDLYMMAQAPRSKWIVRRR